MNKVKNKLTNDSLAIMLLCSDLALNFKIDSVKPFTSLEWSKLAKIIFNSSIKRPSNLFNLSSNDIQEKLLISHEEAGRITTLLSKAGQLSFELNALNDLGIGVITRADSNYPHVLKEKLRSSCPPVIYYCGNISILNNKLVGVVGSRNTDLEGSEFAKSLARKIVKDGYSLVSGGARGVDTISQEEVLSLGGKVAAFIADSMASKIRNREIREGVIKGNLLLMSSINPKNEFTVYSAMERNKYIYSLSDFTIVVSSDYNKGGTWTGAVESIKNKWVPILVRSEGDIPRGNTELIKLGAKVFTNKSFETDFENSINLNVNNEYIE